MSEVEELTRSVASPLGEVEALLLLPPEARCLFVLAHGAGAGMRHPFLRAVSLALARRRVGTFRYQFPYMQRGSRRPDSPPVLTETVRAAVEAAGRETGGLPLIAGGKSMGGRMTSQAAAEGDLPGVRGLAFLGFPLHVAKAKSETRAQHLSRVSLPMLFLQGTRDDLADLSLMRRVVEGLRGRATLHVCEGADHSFHVLKRSGRTDPEVLEEVAGAVSAWLASQPGS